MNQETYIWPIIRTDKILIQRENKRPRRELLQTIIHVTETNEAAALKRVRRSHRKLKSPYDTTITSFEIRNFNSWNI